MFGFPKFTINIFFFNLSVEQSVYITFFTKNFESLSFDLKHKDDDTLQLKIDLMRFHFHL